MSLFQKRTHTAVLCLCLHVALPRAGTFRLVCPSLSPSFDIARSQRAKTKDENNMMPFYGKMATPRDPG